MTKKPFFYKLYDFFVDKCNQNNYNRHEVIFMMKISEINDKIAKDAAAFTAVSDLNYERSIADIASSLANSSHECPVILLSGPSGSGKTTSALMLEKYLDSMGHGTHVLSLDDFFYTLTDRQKTLADRGEFDLESPERIDKKYINDVLEKIIGCEPVNLPRFDFKESSRCLTGRMLKREPGEMVILEGIHALNPSVVTVPGTVGIYVSVRTRLETSDGSVIHPSYIRLLRRMLRDKLFRARSFSKTADMYKSVQAGEQKYILPYKARAKYDIDTFIPYEVNVYRNLILGGLNEEGLKETVPELTMLLSEALPLGTETVKDTSLIREFLGGGIFEY